MQAAIVAAARYGGDTDTLACMTGAFAGALHGPAWLPQDWCVFDVERACSQLERCLYRALRMIWDLVSARVWRLMVVRCTSTIHMRPITGHAHHSHHECCLLTQPLECCTR